MKKIQSLFSEQQTQQIEQAIGRAEMKTSGEIVPVVAFSSGRYDRSEDLFGFFFALLLLSLSWLLFQGATFVPDNWNTTFELNINLPVILIILVAGFFCGVLLASYFPVLALPFLSKKEMQQEVENAAERAFHRFRIRSTQESTGILIYISLYEHMVTVLGDTAINEKIDAEQWKGLCNQVVEGIKKDKMAEGLIAAIEECGNILAEHFPISKNNKNELANKLILIKR